MLAVEASFSENGAGTWLETEVLDYGHSLKFELTFSTVDGINTHPIVNEICIQIMPSVDRPLLLRVTGLKVNWMPKPSIKFH